MTSPINKNLPLANHLPAGIKCSAFLLKSIFPVFSLGHIRTKVRTDKLIECTKLRVIYKKKSTVDCQLKVVGFFNERHVA